MGGWWEDIGRNGVKYGYEWEKVVKKGDILGVKWEKWGM